MTLPASLKTLSTLLHLDIYRRWPLTLNFTSQEVLESWKKCRKPPSHMDITTKDLKDLEISYSKDPIPEMSKLSLVDKERDDTIECVICTGVIDIVVTIFLFSFFFKIKKLFTQPLFLNKYTPFIQV